MKPNPEKVKRHRRLVIGLSALVLLAAPVLIKLNIRPYNITNVLSDSHPALVAYRAHLAKYNDENEIFVLTEKAHAPGSGGAGAGAFSPADLARVSSELVDRFSELPGLLSVRGLANAQYLVHEPDRFTIRPFVDRNGEMSAEAAKNLREDPVYRRVFVDEGRDAILTCLQVRPGLAVPEWKDLMKGILATADAVGEKFPGTETHVLGTEIARFHFMKEILRSQAFVLPVVLLIICGLFYAILRSVVVSLYSLYAMGLAYAIVTAVIVTIEKEISPFSSFALLFIFIVSTSDLVHLFAAISSSEKADFDERIDDGVKHSYWPCLLTSLTNLIGFGSLMLSDLPPIRSFSFYCCLGICLTFVFSFHLLPYVLKIFDVRFHLEKMPLDVSAKGFLGKIRKWRWAVVLGYFAMIGAFCLTSSRITVGEDLYSKFVPSHPLSRAVHAFQERFGFTGSIDVTVKRGGGELLAGESEILIRDLAEELRHVPNVTEVRSIAEPFARVRSLVPELRDPRTHPFTTDFRLRGVYGDLKANGVLDTYLPSGSDEVPDEARLVLLVNSLSTRDLKAMLGRVGTILAEPKYRGAFETGVNGFSTIRTAIVDLIFGSFVKSFFASFFGIFLTFYFLFRSVKWAAIAMIPNLLPIAAVGGLIGMMGIEAEYNLVVLCSIVVGVVVDDTVHFIPAIRERYRATGNMTGALEGTLDLSAKALIGTNLVFILTMPALFLTRIFFFKQIAVILMVVLFMGVVAELVVTPGLLLILERFGFFRSDLVDINSR